VAILETEIRILILYANRRFQRAWDLAQQFANSLERFLLGIHSLSVTRNITTQKSTDKLFITLSALSEKDVFSELFPLSAMTTVDAFFGFPPRALEDLTNLQRRKEVIQTLLTISMDVEAILDGSLDKELRIEFLEDFHEAMKVMLRKRAIQEIKKGRFEHVYKPNDKSKRRNDPRSFLEITGSQDTHEEATPLSQTPRRPWPSRNT
jgi:hypothetical protein